MVTSAQIIPTGDTDAHVHGESKEHNTTDKLTPAVDGKSIPDTHTHTHTHAHADDVDDSHHNFVVTHKVPFSSRTVEVKRRFAERAFWVLDAQNPFRVWCAQVILHPWFDNVILFVILLNAAFMLFAEYDKVYLSGDNVGDLDPSDSVGNNLNIKSDIYFTVIFTLELLVKAVARGFVGEEGCYLHDSWNMLDFVVVVTAWIPRIFPMAPSVSVIRTFRVLRPLKSVSALPELQKIILAMLRAIPQLLYVVGLLVFTYTIFGILGMQLFSGSLHNRCRVTPYPVTKDWTVGSGLNYSDYACLSEYTNPEEYNLDTLLSVGNKGVDNKKASPWFGGKSNCHWPVDDDITLMCNMNDPDKYDPNSYRCYHGEDTASWRWCGSNFDYYGNARFAAKSAATMVDEAMYYEDLLWGYINFDNLARALLTIFQSVTMEAWSDIMYLCMDAVGYTPSSIYFVLLMLLGSFFALNLLLAVLENSFHHEGDEEDEEGADSGEGEEVAEAKQGGGGETTDEKQRALSLSGVGGSDVEAPQAEDGFATVLPEKTMGQRVVDYITDENSLFSTAITLCIVLNTVVLAMDKYPSSASYDSSLGQANTILTFIFGGEMILKLVVLKPSGYVKDRFNIFDGLVVIVSFIEFFLDDGEGGGGGLSALRSFRLFRLFKLARKWATMQRLLQLIVTTLVDVSNFLLLVCLFIFIYAMLGIEFFANRMHFDDDGYPVELTDPSFLNSTVPRHNFDTVLTATVTVYQILSGENWNVVMYDGWRATNWLATVYFVTLMVFGSMFVMNLFLAILLNNFEVDDAEDDEEEEEEEDQQHEGNAGEHTDKEHQHQQAEEMSVPEERASTRESRYLQRSSALDAALAPGTPMPQRPGGLSRSAKQVSAHGLSRVTPAKESPVALSKQFSKSLIDVHTTATGMHKFLQKDVLAEEVRERTQRRLENIANNPNDDSDSVYPLRGKSLWLFDTNNPVRHAVSLIVDHPYFDRTVLMLIVVSSILLALDTPFLNPDGGLKKFLNAMDVIMTVLFTLEMACKHIAMGLYHKQGGGYFQSGWNNLDFVVVSVSIISLTPLGDGLSWFKAIRTLRTLRPLRMINRAPGLKVIVNSVLASIPEIMNVTAVCLFMFLIFAIFSVNYFKGSMRSCQGSHYSDVIATHARYDQILTYPKAWSDMTVDEREVFGPGSSAFSYNQTQTALYRSYSDANWNASNYSSSPPLCDAWYEPSGDAMHGLEDGDDFDWVTSLPTSRVVCECLGGEWEMMVPQSFDNTIWAFLTLFEISTTEGWVDVMWAVVDSRGIDAQPIRDHSILWVWFFMLFIFLGSYLFLNLFVGVTIDNFNRIKAQKDGESILMTPTQKLWVDTLSVSMKMRLTKDVAPPRNALGRMAYNLTVKEPNSVRFEEAIMLCIVGNTVVMMVTWFGQNDAWTATTNVLNLMFAGIFTIEAIVKILALRLHYFSDNWNNFDFTIVILTIVGLVLQYIGASSIGSIASIVRTFRVGRALRLIQGLTEVKRLFKTLMLTLPAVFNILTLLLLLFFIFTIVGIQLFATVAIHDDVTQHTNLRYFSRSFIVLLRFSTGENWNGFMHSIASDVDNCVRNPVYDERFCGFNDEFDCLPLEGCGNSAIYIYMILFNVIVAFVFVNLFIGVILEGFDQSNDSLKLVHDEDFEWFSKIWKRFDPEATCLVQPHLLPSFARALLTPVEATNTSFRVIRQHWAIGDDPRAVSSYTLENIIRSIHSQTTPIKIIDVDGCDYVHFKNVLVAFVDTAFRLHAENEGRGADMGNIKQDQQSTILTSLLKTQVDTYLAKDTFEHSHQTYTIEHRHAAVVIFRTVLGWKLRKDRKMMSATELARQMKKSSTNAVPPPPKPVHTAGGMDRTEAHTEQATSAKTPDALGPQAHPHHPTTTPQTPADPTAATSTADATGEGEERDGKDSLAVLDKQGMKTKPSAPRRHLGTLPHIAGDGGKLAHNSVHGNDDPEDSLM